MKTNKHKIFLSLAIFFAIILSISIFAINSIRYSINEPMMDIEYKKQIIKDSHNPFYRLENLRSLVGPEEMAQFVKANDENPKIYTRVKENKNFRANFHMHTINSDGRATVQQLLQAAKIYANTFPDDGYMYVAITDHNTVNGAKDVIKELQAHPKEYNKIKVVAGMEIFTQFVNEPTKPIEIHVLTWCINPYDEFLNKEFYKKDLTDRYNRIRPDRDFDWVINTMKNYGIVGIAHPARYTSFLKEQKYSHIDTMLDRYKKNGASNNILFVEGYYQSYPQCGEKDKLGNEYEKYLNYINEQAHKRGIYRTGSTDVHGGSIFTK